jgi:hypothetical protein
MTAKSEGAAFNRPLRELTSLGWAALTVIVGQALSGFVVPDTVSRFRFLALFGAIVGLGLANLLNVNRRSLLALLALSLFIGWGAVVWFSILVESGTEVGAALYLGLSLLLILAFACFGVALRTAGLVSEKSETKDGEERLQGPPVGGGDGPVAPTGTAS